MININGTLVKEHDASFPVSNRGFNYGDAVFETIKVVHDKILFWEDHYFRLMASMRILRMEIPMHFTMEFLEEEIKRLLSSNHQQKTSVRVKLSVYRDGSGLYLPSENNVGYTLTSKTLNSDFYVLDDKGYIVDLYKDHYILSGLLSNIKTNNRIINVLASIYAKENGLDNCLLLNEKKQVVEATNGNVFLIKGHIIKTSPLESGILKGIMRKQLIDIINQTDDLELVEEPISPFELQKSDELFITNVISGIIPITRYRKKEFTDMKTKKILAKLNTKIRLG